MDNTEILYQKVQEYKKQLGVWGGFFNLLLISLGACITKIPKLVGIGGILCLCILFGYILKLNFRIKKLNKEIKELS